MREARIHVRHVRDLLKSLDPSDAYNGVDCSSLSFLNVITQGDILGTCLGLARNVPSWTTSPVLSIFEFKLAKVSKFYFHAYKINNLTFTAS